MKYDKKKSREIWIESRLECLEKEFKNDGSDQDNAVWQEICELSKEHLFLTNPDLIGTPHFRNHAMKIMLECSPKKSAFKKAGKTAKKK